MAAWYAVFAPCVAVCMIFIGLAIWDSHEASYRYNPASDDAFGAAAFFAISSVIASILCLFGIRRHGWRVIIWKSALGFIASCLIYLWVFLKSMAELCHQ